LAAIQADEKLLLHLNITESVMDILDAFRQLDTKDEDLKVVQFLGIRQFNALASAIKLMNSGYYQKSALILRDVLETVFLIDLFGTDRSTITKWRCAGKAARLKAFMPVRVREALDKRDGFTSNKRADLYALFSDLAGHASMEGIPMLKQKGSDDIYLGPFFDVTSLEATLSEMGKLAVQIGENMNRFVPEDWRKKHPSLRRFYGMKAYWLKCFYPKLFAKILGES
jgi:hypothetical protein